jgi:hypothetical protein
MFVFEWGIALHNLEFERVLAGEKPPRLMLRHSLPIVRKATRQLLKDYVLFPLIGGPSAPFVLAGDAAANIVRNVWAFLVIFCGHFPDGVAYAPEGSVDATEPETRGAWYLRQIRGSANIEGPAWSTFSRGTWATKSSITSSRTCPPIATLRSPPRSSPCVGGMASHTRRVLSCGKSEASRGDSFALPCRALPYFPRLIHAAARGQRLREPPSMPWVPRHTGSPAHIQPPHVAAQRLVGRHAAGPRATSVRRPKLANPLATHAASIEACPTSYFGQPGVAKHDDRGSYVRSVGTRQDMAEALTFAAEVKVQADIEGIAALVDHPGLRCLQPGDVASRVVSDFALR